MFLDPSSSLIDCFPNFASLSLKHRRRTRLNRLVNASCKSSSSTNDLHVAIVRTGHFCPARSASRIPCKGCPCSLHVFTESPLLIAWSTIALKTLLVVCAKDKWDLAGVIDPERMRTVTGCELNVGKRRVIIITSCRYALRSGCICHYRARTLEYEVGVDAFNLDCFVGDHSASCVVAADRVDSLNLQDLRFTDVWNCE